MASIEAHNAQEVAELQRRQRRTTYVMLGSAAAMVAGCVGPCLVGSLLRSFLPQYFTPYVPLSGLLLPLIGLGGLLLMLGSRRRYNLALAMARRADELGLRYTYEPGLDAAPALRGRRFVTMPNVLDSALLAHLMEGVYKKRPLLASEFGHNYVLGSKVRHANQTVVAFPTGFERFPDFAVLPYGWAEAWLRVVGAIALPKPFKVPGENEFNRRFAVVGQAPDRILPRLTPAVIDGFLEDRQLAAEVSDGVLVVFRREVVVRVDGYEDLLIQASRVARALERAPAE